jgi:monoterpene epsilon-lactone hydrolase
MSTTTSREAADYASFLADVRAMALTAGLSLPILRAISDSFHRATAEPEGVSYAEVDADGVPALWCIPAGASPEHALLHMHFGGSVVASMHSDRKAAGHIAKATGVRSLVLDSRLAPEHPYPAQLDDVETAFHWLLDQGYEADKVGSTGHSIGGNLAVSLPLRLLARGKATPGAVLSISPWCDLTLSNPTIDTNADSDKMLTRELLEMFRDAWIGQVGMDFADPLVNLQFADLSGLPPTYVSYGESELLAGEGALLGERVQALGNGSVVDPLPGGQHSFILGAGRVPEVDESITRMGTWLRHALKVGQ